MNFSDYFDKNKEELEIMWFDDQVDDKAIVDYLISSKKFAEVKQAIINESGSHIGEWACKKWQMEREA